DPRREGALYTHPHPPRAQPGHRAGSGGAQLPPQADGLQRRAGAGAPPYGARHARPTGRKRGMTMVYIGIDVGGTTAKAGVVDESGNILCKASCKTGIGRNFEDVAADMV